MNKTGLYLVLSAFLVVICGSAFAQVSPGVAEIDFGVDADTGGIPFIGAPGSGVAVEDALDSAVDDFFLYPGILTPPNDKVFDENVPPGFFPALNLGTLVPPEITDAYCFSVPPVVGPPVVPAIDALVGGGGLFVQFTVAPASGGTVGLPGSAVNFESVVKPTAPESGGDVFESIVVGTNVLIIDQTVLGLRTIPEDDVNALIVTDSHLGGPTLPFAAQPLAVDTDGVPGADAPLVYYSLKFSATYGPIGDDIYMTAPFTGAPGPGAIGWTGVNLGLPGGVDEIDALYVEDPFGALGGPFIYFSLAPGSASLTAPSPIVNGFNISGTGADPGDIIGVVPAVPAGIGGLIPPGAPPAVVVTAATLGLTGDLIGNPGAGEDDLNGVHFSPFQIWSPTSVDDWMMH